MYSFLQLVSDKNFVTETIFTLETIIYLLFRASFVDVSVLVANWNIPVSVDIWSEELVTLGSLSKVEVIEVLYPGDSVLIHGLEIALRDII